MESSGIRGDLTRLVPPDRSLHLENCLRWMNDPRVTLTLPRMTGVSRLEEEAFFDKIEANRDSFVVWAILNEKGQHIGITHLTIDWPMQSASGGLIIGEPAAWGKGFATDVIQTRLRFALDQLNLHRVEGHTFNPAMKRVYEKSGYQHEGTWRQKIWREGKWHDADLYAVLASDPRAS